METNSSLKKRRYVIFPLILSIFAVWLLQTNILISSDITYLLDLTKQLLAGGAYGKDIFEVNPPMILYLYSPVCLLAKFTSFNPIDIFRIYVFLLIFFSVFACSVLLEKIIHQQDKGLFYLLIYILLFVQLFLPVNEFGQREHLLMIFMLPYLFSAVLVLEKKRIAPFYALIIGLLAGLGFAMKPFFLLPLIFIELYLIFIKRNIGGWVRIESIAVLCVLCIYLASVFLLQPGYVKIMLPLAAKFYFIGIKESWAETFSKFTVLFCCLALLVYFAFGKVTHYRYLVNVLMLALVGMMLAFIIPRAAWYYHVLPACALACLLIVSIMFSDKKLNNFTSSKMIYSFVFYAAAVIFIPLMSSTGVFIDSVYEKNEKNKLIAYVRALPQNNKAVVCFSGNTTKDCFPPIADAERLYSGRHAFFWWLKGMLKLEKTVAIEQIVPFRQYFFDGLADDLNRGNLVLLNMRDYHDAINSNADFDFVLSYSANEKFRTAWQHYRYLTTIEDYRIYQRFS